MDICLNRNCLTKTRNQYMVAYGTQVVEVHEDCVCKPCAERFRKQLIQSGHRNVRIIQQDPVQFLFPLHPQYT